MFANFLPETWMDCPDVDILTWTFAKYGSYDVDRPVYVDAADPRRSLSACQTMHLVRQAINGFRHFGLEKGDCVCIHAFNNLAVPIAWLGAIGAGGCITTSNPSYTSLEFKHHLSITNAKYIVTEAELYPRIFETALAFGIPLSRIFVVARSGEDAPDGHKYTQWNDVLQHGEGSWERFDDAELAEHTIAAISSTSGTTGLPKGGLLSHKNLIAQNIVIMSQGKKPYQISYLLAIPITHGFAGGLAHITPLRTGHTVYLLERFEMGPFINAIQRFKPTEVAVVPTILASLLDSSQVSQPLLTSLRYIHCAGAPLKLSIQLKLYDMLSPAAIVGQVWGLTEMGWVTQFQWPERDDTGSVGRQCPSQEIKLVDDYGRPITESNVEGEAYVRGPNLFLGYHGDPSFNKQAFSEDGWFKTGDLMLCKDGKWYITGRKKDVFKVRGRQVSPTEIEFVLLGHPRIADAAVVGVPARQPATGDAPRAYVVRKQTLDVNTSAAANTDTVSMLPECPVTEEEVKTWVLQRLAKYKALDGGVEFVDRIPRSASGKILRRLLKPTNVVGQVVDSGS